ncbi:hypothetical protein ACFLVM_02120 [Chloroflexota bacterium]
MRDDHIGEKETQHQTNHEGWIRLPESKTELLEEMCKLDGMFQISLQGVSRGLTWAEANIIGRKVSPLFDGVTNPKAFPVSEDAKENDFNILLTNPAIDCPLPDTLIMNTAMKTPIPVQTMERILRTLLGQPRFSACKRLAAERVNSRKQE